MTLTSNNLKDGGLTAHYQFQYDDSLAGGLEPARTKQVVAACEGDFKQMSAWFGNVALDVNFRIPVNITQNTGGAAWGLSGGNLTVTINPGNSDAGIVRYLLVAEMVEQYMRAQNRGWYGSGTEGSEGEGLSRFLASQFLAINALGLPPEGAYNSNAWLASARADFVNNVRGKDDGSDEVTGCSLLFIYYLFSQLGFSIEVIVAAGANTLGGVYRNLTGDTADPFPFFRQLVDTYFPGTSTITKGNLDNPFPLKWPPARIPHETSFAVWPAPGIVEVFWVRPDGMVFYNGRRPDINNGDWNNPVPIAPNPGSADPRSGVAAVCPAPGIVEVFWVRPDGMVFTNGRDPNINNGNWNNPINNVAPNPGSAAIRDV